MLIERQGNQAGRRGDLSGRTNPLDASSAPPDRSLTSLLLSDRPAALKRIEEKLIPSIVNNAMAHSESIKALHERTNSRVAVKRIGEGLSILVKDIDLAKLNIVGTDTIYRDIERSMGRDAAKRGQKGRINIRITPKEVTAVLEEMDYEEKGIWSPVETDASVEIAAHAPQIVALMVEMIDFERAERILETQAERATWSSGPSYQPVYQFDKLDKPASVKTPLPNKIELLTSALKTAEAELERLKKKHAWREDIKDAEDKVALVSHDLEGALQEQFRRNKPWKHDGKRKKGSYWKNHK